ncbi:DUF4880 domain-containing protein [Gluconacetobacter azotocaptans]|uniref:FecR family protein n=1 Tax=Gluconacetobacter azotocaptans TaxID=142834 RepID=UPI00195C4B24|nr:DUF4880 domain-containing protein [Gluconacetobacter azotocaptans]MBM9402751.1 DUF4880 domain-containing protein [Gluconacetobacter azotocaptans]
MSSSITRTAARWMARLHAEDCSEADRQAFRAWLAEDARHRAIFEQASDVWAEAGGLAPSHAPSAAISRRAPLRAGHLMPTRRAVLAGGMLLGAGLLVDAPRPAEAEIYTTAIGRQRRLHLGPKIDILLDTDTTILVPPHARHRRLVLRCGQAAIGLAQRDHPYRVETPTHALLADCGQFDIRLIDRRLTATVLAGSLAVLPRTAGAGQPVRLEAGQRLRVDPDLPPRIDRPPVEDLMAWQSGRLAFRETPLGDAVREMNRYSITKMELAPDGVATLRISGFYHAGNTAGFVRALQALLPVKVRQGQTIHIMKLL